MLLIYISALLCGISAGLLIHIAIKKLFSRKRKELPRDQTLFTVHDIEALAVGWGISKPEWSDQAARSALNQLQALGIIEIRAGKYDEIVFLKPRMYEIGFKPFPEQPRIDSDQWLRWTESKPPVGQEFEYVRDYADGSSVPIRAMLRNCIEHRAGETFYTSDPMIVSEDNKLIGWEFQNPEEISWRAVNVIFHPLT